MTATDQIPDAYTSDGSCWADAELRGITGVSMVEGEKGRHRVRVDVELDVRRCDHDDFDDDLVTKSYTFLRLDEAEQLAREILAAVEQLRTGTA